MAYVTGKSGSFTFGNSLFTFQVNWSETYEIASNSSIVSIDSLKVKTTVYGGKWHPHLLLRVNGKTVAAFNYYKPATHAVAVKADGAYYTANAQSSGVSAPWKSAAITHNADGSKDIDISVVCNELTSVQLFRESDRKIITFGTGAEKNISLTDIPRFATLTSAPNFNDEDNPTITYSNPAGNSVTLLRACISLDGSKADIAYRDISKTGNSYAFNLTEAERDVLRAATTGANSRTVKFYIRSEIGANYQGSNLSRTFTIKNPQPLIDPTITDTNSVTVALTGDSSKLIRYYSNAHVIIDAQAVKKATLKSQKVTCGSKSLNGDGTIEGVESNSFVITATDSRGNTTKETVTPAFVDYVKLTCNLANNRPTADGEMTVKVTGNYFNGSFGASSNTLSVYYRYKVSGGSYSEWKAMSVTPGSGNYSATANLTGLDYQTTYVFQAYAVDKLATVQSAEKSVKSTPVFDWSENDFKFNVPVFDEFATSFVNGLAAYTGGGDSGIDPNTTLEALCLTSHSNAPQGLGTFYYIHTAFYNTKSAGAARAQVAFPYSKNGSIYHRYYASGAWSAWARYMNADEAYPVGSIYIAYNSTSPASLFGGTWTRIEGRVLYGCAASGTIGATGSHTTGSGSSSLPYVNVAIWRRTA